MSAGMCCLEYQSGGATKDHPFLPPPLSTQAGWQQLQVHEDKQQDACLVGKLTSPSSLPHTGHHFSRVPGQ